MILFTNEPVLRILACKPRQTMKEDGENVDDNGNHS